jgi:macrolide transport system ATP-binding/permease protein
MWNGKRCLAKFGNLFRRERAERELAREVESHLALIEEEYSRRGIGPEEARLAARRIYGGIEQAKELHRDERSIIWIEQTLSDVRYACRNLARNPGFALVVTLTLTLGIGVNATLFSAYNAVALKPLPVADPNQVVRFERWFEHGFRGETQYGFSYPEYAYCRDHNDVFSSLVAVSWPNQVVVQAGETPSAEPEIAAAQFVSQNYFADLGISSRLGRTFLRQEGRVPGADPVAVISHPFWDRHFHSNPQIIGRVLQVNGILLTVIGVAPEEFTGTSTLPQVPDLWVPLSMQTRLLPGPDWTQEPDNQPLQILARLKPSTTPKRAQAESDSLIRQVASTFRAREKTLATTLQPTAFFGNTDDLRFKSFIASLMLLVGSVLVVACVNVTNMLLARGAARQREIGVRLALGASRARIIRQLLTESILLSLLGGVGGLVASIWTAKLLWVSILQVFTGLFAGNVVFRLDLNPDMRVFVYSLVLSLLTGVLFGLSPALELSRPDLTRALKEEGRSLGRRWSRSRLRAFLVATQVGVCMVLLISTGLLLRGLLRSQAAQPGFETHRVLLLSGDFGRDPEKSVTLERHLIEGLQSLPGVKAAALGTFPLLGTWTPPILIEGSRAPQTKSGDRTLASYASDTYFNTVGIQLLRGRAFTDREAANNAHVAVISESTARRFWPGENSLGKLFKLDLDFRGTFTAFEVVGIAKDVRFANLTRIDPTHVYVPTGTKDFYGILVRSQGDPMGAIAAVRHAVEGLDENLARSLWFRTIEGGPLHLQKSMAQIAALYAGILAFVALVLAAVGIYGVMAYLVNQRTREIGIRMALGSTTVSVLKTVLLEGLRPACAGILLGMLGAAALTWALHSSLVFPGAVDFFYGLPFYDPVTFLGLAGFFILIVGMATLVPARRAIRVDPMVALRFE